MESHQKTLVIFHNIIACSICSFNNCVSY